ncbi:MAG TPA: TrbI/VirB10 family protein [Candidatus Angelobacter sp.]|jgi:hypothetical protein|nr:TrbI/VirB10 family protein [Candidatus Angelobacter sp.]
MDHGKENESRNATPTRPEPSEVQLNEAESGDENPTGFAKISKAFNDALNRTRRQQKPVANRRELGADKSKTVVMLVAVAIALILVFFAVFSHPNKKPAPGEGNRAQPSLGRRVTRGAEHDDASKSVTPVLDAKVQGQNNGNLGQVTPEDINRTSRDIPRYNPQAVPAPDPKSKPSPATREAFALKNVSFGDANDGQLAPPPPLPNANANRDLKKTSILFVLATQASPRLSPSIAPGQDELNDLMGVMPPGTKLVGRLQAPISSAVSAPVVAVVEYNYEHNGMIILPAGAKVIGKLTQATATGVVNVQFNRIEMPDGTTEKIDASAMDLKYGPLKGNVSGKKRGTHFLVSSLTGLGTVASFLVGAHGTTGIDGPISENALLRERIADNVGQGGQQELNSLALNQTFVVTVPGNTRFYIVLQKGTGNDQEKSMVSGAAQSANSSVACNNGSVPTLQELRQLMELRKEINQMYQQSSTPALGQSQDQ